MSENTTPQVSLECKPSKSENELVFPYVVTNRGPGTVLVSDAYHGYDAASHTAYADYATLVVAAQPDGYALVLRGIPPMPPFAVTRPVFPLVRRVEPGGRIEGQMRVALPLAEASPYRAYSNVRDYTQIPIQGVTIALDWIPATAPGLTTSAAAGADGLLTLYAPSLAHLMTRTECRYPTRGLLLLVRKS